MDSNQWKCAEQFLVPPFLPSLQLSSASPPLCKFLSNLTKFLWNLTKFLWNLTTTLALFATLFTFEHVTLLPLLKPRLSIPGLPDRPRQLCPCGPKSFNPCISAVVFKWSQFQVNVLMNQAAERGEGGLYARSGPVVQLFTIYWTLNQMSIPGSLYCYVLCKNEKQTYNQGSL